MTAYQHFYKQLDAGARRLFPSLNEREAIQWEYLVSPFELTLPVSVLDRATRAIGALYRVSRAPNYRAQLEDSHQLSTAPPANQSVLMAYDFHTTADGHCYLVEINTNAAGFMVGSLMEMTHTQAEAEEFKPLQELRRAFETELDLCGFHAPPIVAITDDDIAEQKMFVEFLMYRDWFTRLGWKSEFCEGREFTREQQKLLTPALGEVSLVYNRLTDFYFTDESHSVLRDAYFHGLACVTPNPREYWLLADKQRLIQFSEPGLWERAGASERDAQAIRDVLLPAFDKSAWPTREALWAERKSLFFKPKRSYGGKSAYRGESVSRKVFERLMDEDILIQRYQPAQAVPHDDPRSVLNNWKFDLRFYVYADRIQFAVARIYQGQVTNFSSPMGGFTAVRFR